MNRQRLKDYYFIPAEIEGLERCREKYRQLLGDRSEGLSRTINEKIKMLLKQSEETGAFIASIKENDIRAIIENRYKARKDWETVYINVYGGAHSEDPAQYCKRKLDRYLQKRKEQEMKKEIVNVAEAFFPDDQEEATEETTPEAEPVKRGTLVFIPERKTARMQLLVRPSSKEDLKVLAEARGQSVNDLLNTLIENFIDAEKAKAGRK